MRRIHEDIKNQTFQKVYLLYGQESYLLRQYRDRLVKAMTDPEDVMNYNQFRGRDISPGSVIDQGETMPFFADRRVILVEDSGFFKKSSDDLADYIGQLPDYLCLIFCEDEIDKRNRLYKAVQKNGHCAEFPQQTEDTLMRWVLGILTREGKKITRPDMDFFLASTGRDMNHIHNELEKVLSYTQGRDVISRADIEAVSSSQLINRIFDMVRAVAFREQKKAMDLYHDLLSMKEPPLKILSLLQREFNNILKVKELGEKGIHQKEIVSATGLHPFAVKNYAPLGRRYSSRQLVQAVADMVQAEEDVKTGRLGDLLSVELILIKYSR